MPDYKKTYDRTHPARERLLRHEKGLADLVESERLAVEGLSKATPPKQDTHKNRPVPRESLLKALTPFGSQSLNLFDIISGPIMYTQRELAQADHNINVPDAIMNRLSSLRGVTRSSSTTDPLKLTATKPTRLPDPSMIEGGDLNLTDLQGLANLYKKATRQEELRGTTEPAPRGDQSPLGRDTGTALTEFGLRLAASRRPDTLGAIGEAGLGALKTYQGQQASAAARALEARKVSVQESLGTAQASHFKALAKQATQKNVKDISQDGSGEVMIYYTDGSFDKTGIIGPPNNPHMALAAKSLMDNLTDPLSVGANVDEIIENGLRGLSALSIYFGTHPQGQPKMSFSQDGTRTK